VFSAASVTAVLPPAKPACSSRARDPPRALWPSS